MKYNSFFVFLSFIGLLSLFACQNEASQDEKTPEAAINDTPFFVDDASHLYFKNVRAYYYDESPGPGANAAERMNLYQLRKFSKSPDRPILYPIIVDNWIKDEAYLFIEKNEYKGGFKDPITVLALENSDTTTIELARPNRKTQLSFVELLETHIEQGQELFVLDTLGTTVPIFVDKQDQLNFLTTVKDYKKLVK